MAKLSDKTATDLLLKKMTEYIQLSPADRDLVLSKTTVRKVRKRQFLLQEGDVQRALIFVTEGCLRSYDLAENGAEHIIQFAPPEWWIADIHSFNHQEPASFYIDTLEDSTVLLIEKSDLEALFTAIPSLERFFRMLAENALATYQHRLRDKLSLSAQERYTNFCKLYPSLIQRLPQRQIAAYIGVTPEFFSKMLNQPIAKGNN